MEKYILTKEELQSFAERINEYDTGAFDFNYGYDIVDKTLFDLNLIPTKTLNPSEKKGFDIARLLRSIENILNDKYFIRNDSKEYKYGFEHALILVKGSINDIIAYQANGEKPEVVNPVPSLFELLSNEFGDHSKDYEDICELIVNRRNGRETDKEEPKTREEQIQYINDVLNVGYDKIVSIIFNYVHKSVPH